MDTSVIGKNIKKLRKSKKLTQAVLSERVDISRNYLSDIECGNKSPSFKTIIKIADALNVDINMITGDTTIVGKQENISALTKRLLDLPDKEYRKIMQIIEVLLKLLDEYI